MKNFVVDHKDILGILTKHDPIGIFYENNTDEYEPESKSIADRINDSNSEKEINQIVYEEFVRWFGKDTVGSREKYDKIAIEIIEFIRSKVAE